MSLRGAAAIVSFAELPTRRNYPGRTTLSLMAEVSRLAIQDARLRKEDIDGVITPEDTNPLTFAEYAQIKPSYTAGMTVHGSSGATSIATAAAAIHAGLCNYVLCVFASSRDPEVGGRQPGGFRGGAPPVGPANRGTEWEAPFGPVIAANGGYGLIMQRHMFEYGTKPEQFAKVAVDQRFNALTNPNAVFNGQPITIDDVLNSRYINDPLHLLESVMPCAGAGAVIVTSAERARAMPNPPVYILGAAGAATNHDVIWQEPNITTSPVAISAPKALRMAGYNVNDIEFAEFYDCYTILVAMCIEDAGFCPKGEVGNFYWSTDTTYRGEFPINTDGGQLSGGQPGLAGGFRHVVEATRQLMGRADDRQVRKKNLCMVNG